MAERARPPIDGGTVLVTGASAGIGRELAVQLAPRAKALILLARRAARLEELRTWLLARHPRLQVLTLPVDLSDDKDVDRALADAGERGGAVDVLVNNAGVGIEALADQADWARVRTVLHTNVLAVAQLTTALVPAMVERGRGGGAEHGLGGRADGDARGCGVLGQQAFHGRVQRGTARGSNWHRGGGHPGLPRPGGQRVRPDRRVGGRDERRPAAVRADQRGPMCARALAGFDRGVPLVFPGRAYRIAMRALPLLPRELSRRQAARSATRIRSTAKGLASAPDRPEGQVGA